MSPTCGKDVSNVSCQQLSGELNAMANRYFNLVKYVETFEELMVKHAKFLEELKIGGRGPHCWKFVATDYGMSNTRKKQHKNILGNSENILSTSQANVRPLVPRGSSVSSDPEEKILEEKLAVCAYYYSLLCEKDISDYSTQQLSEELDAFTNHYIKLVKHVEKLEESVVKPLKKLKESKTRGRGPPCFKYVASDREMSEQEVQQIIDRANGVECSTSMTTGSGRGGGSDQVDEVDDDQQLTIKGTKLTLMDRFKRTGDQRMAAFEEMLRHRLLLNFMDDEGHDDGQLLEEDKEEK
ncbi:unnamed protein product [Meloidogyne enterolobii]|uniref:Uncharacterized protein n=1 Tax=Meloidogyne enterolobii TaxID=390850 RepID=A0ACB1AYN8_MELEN